MLNKLKLPLKKLVLLSSVCIDRFSSLPSELQTKLSDKSGLLSTAVAGLNVSRVAPPGDPDYGQRRLQVRRKSDAVNLIYYKVLRKVARIKRLWIKVNRSHAALSAATSSIADTKLKGIVRTVDEMS